MVESGITLEIAVSHCLFETASSLKLSTPFITLQQNKPLDVTLLEREPRKVEGSLHVCLSLEKNTNIKERLGRPTINDRYTQIDESNLKWQ
jgi:hypothetical protein